MSKIIKWIKNMKSSDIDFIEDKIDILLEKSPPNIDKVILQKINELNNNDIIPSKANLDKSDNQPKTKLSKILKFAIPVIAACICLLVGLFFILNMEQKVLATVISFSGEPLIEKNGSVQGFTLHDMVQEGSTIVTKNDSTVIQISQKELIKIDKSSRLSLTKLTEKNVNLFLSFGTVFIKTYEPHNNELSHILTPNAKIEYGSILSVEYNKNQSIVTLYKGKASVEYINITKGKEIFTLQPSNTVIIAGGILKEVSTIPESSKHTLAMIQEMALIKKTSISSNLSISTGLPSTILIINDKKIDNFDYEIQFSLNPGTYSIRFEKNGYEPVSETIRLAGGETIHRDIYLPGIKESEQKVEVEVEPEISRKWESRIIHTYMNPDDSSSSRILGLETSGDYLVIVTKTSLFCLSKSGKLIWGKNYKQEHSIFFNSMPEIYNNSLYISANNLFISINIKSGDDSITKAPGIIGDGYKIIENKGKLYLPFAAGIYYYTLKNTEFSNKPLILIICPTTPCITDKSFYVTSELSPEIGYFNQSGNLMKKEKLKNKSICSPIKLNRNIISGDIEGNIYIFDLSLNLLSTLKVEGMIFSIVQSDSNYFYTLTSEGNIYMVNVNNNGIPEIMEKVTCDASPKSNLYYYKSPLYNNKKLYFGTNQGDIIIIGIPGTPIEYIHKVSSSGISCSMVSAMIDNDDAYFLGTERGEVILLEKK